MSFYSLLSTKKRTCIADKYDRTGCSDVSINVPNLASMLGEAEKTIKRDIAATL